MTNRQSAIFSREWHYALACEYDRQEDRSDEIAHNKNSRPYRPYEWDRHALAIMLAYDAFIRETHTQFKRMIETCGIDVIFTDEDPYEEPSALFADLDVKVLRVFTGGELPVNHPMRELVRVFTGPRMPLPISTSINNVFRAVHDYYGHYGGPDNAHYEFGTTAAGLGGNGLTGEELAYQRHKAMYSRDAWLALTVETRCQTAANNLLPRVIETGGFIEQKAVWLPEWCYLV